MRRNQYTEYAVERFGKDILKSKGMQAAKAYRQHGAVSVYEHSVTVAKMCVMLAILFKVHVNVRSLVRGALLHDYFLYDWHKSDQGHRLHAFFHAERALQNATRDFFLNDIEKNMIQTHMFPLNFALPKYRESIILCVADKICAAGETVLRRSDRGNCNSR